MEREVFLQKFLHDAGTNYKSAHLEAYDSVRTLRVSFMPGFRCLLSPVWWAAADEQCGSGVKRYRCIFRHDRGNTTVEVMAAAASGALVSARAMLGPRPGYFVEVWDGKVLISIATEQVTSGEPRTDKPQA